MATQRKTAQPKVAGKVMRAKRVTRKPSEKWVIFYPKERGEIPRAQIRAAIDAVWAEEKTSRQ